MTRRLFALANLLTLAGFTLYLLLVAAPAKADPVPADTARVQVTKARVIDGKMHVSWSNGKSRVLNPCVYEDGRNCYWAADKRGNKVGNSFLVSFGQIWYADDFRD